MSSAAIVTNSCRKDSSTSITSILLRKHATTASYNYSTERTCSPYPIYYCVCPPWPDRKNGRKLQPEPTVSTAYWPGEQTLARWLANTVKISPQKTTEVCCRSSRPARHSRLLKTKSTPCAKESSHCPSKQRWVTTSLSSLSAKLRPVFRRPIRTCSAD